MQPGLVVKLRPSGPWRIGPDSGARNRVDVIYHSDSLYSAVTSAMSRLGRLDAWLDATARSQAPAVCFSSCFPFVEETRFVIPPRTLWPPASQSRTAGRVRWKSARFIPLSMVQAILAGERLDDNRWSVDGPSGCLVPAGKPGPFRTAVRWGAAVDRLSGVSERHSTACIEFRPGAGLWTVIGFADEGGRDQWQDAVKAAFRLLADTGFGGERSRGWGRAETPEFIEGELPGMIIGEARGVSASSPGADEIVRPAQEATGLAEVAQAVPPADPESFSALEEADAIQSGTEPDITLADARGSDQSRDREGAFVEPEVAAEPASPVSEPEGGIDSGITLADARGSETGGEPTSEQANEISEAGVEPSTEPESGEAQQVASSEIAELRVEPDPEAPPAEPSPLPPIQEPPAEQPSAEEPPAPEPPPPPVNDPVPPIDEPGPPPPEPEPEPVVRSRTAPLPRSPERENGRGSARSHWLLSLFTPAAADTVDWARGNYTVLARGGRVDSPAGSGELKKQIRMVAEGSVLIAEDAPRGSASDVAPDGFAHPVFRAGFALAITLPEGQ